ncbi:MAG TPA: DUF4149 domain-containing protein [Bryobacteraceae bacterium]|nr:DUF4149 domain-containing protein [Bryobacteraceae bacterium]
MHTRRFAVLILGIWAGISLAMVFVAIHNFRGVDQLLEAPHAQAGRSVQKLGPASTRELLRYQVSELNRFYFEWYGIAQISLALLLALTLLFATRADKIMMVLSGVLLLVVVFEHKFLTPEITYLGRLIDFTAPDVPSAPRIRFWSFHKIYSGMEVFKFALFLAVALKMVVRGDMRRHAPRHHDVLEGPLELR